MSRGRKLPKVLTEDEQDRMLATFNTRHRSPHRDKVACQLMLATGLRVGELCALRDEHVDLDTCRLVVREGKGAKDRTLWFSDKVAAALKGWMHRKPDSQFTFPTKSGRAVSPSHLRRRVKRAARDAEIKEWSRVSPHNLRHTFASQLLHETGNLRLVQKALGHASIQTTTIYTHICDTALAGAMRSFRSDPDPEPMDNEHEPNLAAILQGADSNELREALVDELISRADPELVREAFMRVVA